LEDKLQQIANTLGKVDENGQVTEDLRTQILGQLNTRLSYDRLYQDAVHDPSLRRTQQEIEVALTNANLAREVVFELFQDLDRFKLSDYKQVDDEGRAIQRLVAFVQKAARLDGGEFRSLGNDRYELSLPGLPIVQFTIDRERAVREDDLNLLGLEHPIVKSWLYQYANLPPEERGLVGSFPRNEQAHGVLSIWQVRVSARGGQMQQKIISLGMSPNGERSPALERLVGELIHVTPPIKLDTFFNKESLSQLVNGTASDLLHRQLEYTGLLEDGASYSSKLLACIQIII